MFDFFMQWVPSLTVIGIGTFAIINNARVKKAYDEAEHAHMQEVSSLARTINSLNNELMTARQARQMALVALEEAETILSGNIRPEGLIMAERRTPHVPLYERGTRVSIDETPSPRPMQPSALVIDVHSMPADRMMAVSQGDQLICIAANLADAHAWLYVVPHYSSLEVIPVWAIREICMSAGVRVNLAEVYQQLAPNGSGETFDYAWGGLMQLTEEQSSAIPVVNTDGLAEFEERYPSRLTRLMREGNPLQAPASSTDKIGTRRRKLNFPKN